MAREWWGQQRVRLSGPCFTLQVVAVVMDMFTHVDLLSEVLEAASAAVPVYILLDGDECTAISWTWPDKCRSTCTTRTGVAGERRTTGRGAEAPVQRPLTPLPPQFLRGAHCGGPTYYCRTGKSLHGHVRRSSSCGLCRVSREPQVRPAPCLRIRGPPPEALL